MYLTPTDQALKFQSYLQKNRYIVAQTPLPTTVEDFLTLVIQEESPCIVSMDGTDLQDMQGPEKRTVYHFQYTSWGNGEKAPSDAAAFLQLTRDVERVSSESEVNGPIIVHCLTGAERSGLFCAVSILVQKMEIDSQEQYQFCHQCLASYIQSLETESSHM